MDDKNLDVLGAALDRLLLGDIRDPFQSDDPGTSELFEKLEKLRVLLIELQAYTVALSQGDVESTPPGRRNYLAAGIKQLQAQLRHLTWQAQCIASGDYGQHIDFMGEFSEAFNTMRDQLHEREEGLVAQRNAMFAVFDNIEQLILVRKETTNEILYANRMAQKRFSLDAPPETPGSQDHDLLNNLFAITAPNRREIFDKASNRWYSINCSILPWSAGESAQLYHCFDITSHKRRELDLEQAANTDSLTGLLNRRAFEAVLETEWRKTMRANAPLSFFVIDIDHFKKCNDTYGHVHGDTCLRYLADTMRNTITRSHDAIARFGGEEFVAVLPFTDMKGALAVAEAIRRAVEKLAIPLQEDPAILTYITVSIGVSTLIPTEQALPTQLMLAADAALYDAKHSGRNRVCHR